MRRHFQLILLVLLFQTAPIYAEELDPFKGNLEFSYLDTSGNTDSTTFATSGKWERTFPDSKWTGEAAALYGKREGLTSDKNWLLRLKYDRNISDLTYGFLMGSAERNVLKGIEIRYTLQTGLGHYFIKTERDLLKGEVGLGYLRENQVSPFPDNGYPTARLFGEYNHSFSQVTRFTQTAEFLFNLERGSDYLFNEESAFITNLMNRLALKVSYAIAFDHLPPPGFTKTDRLFKTALLLTF